MADYRLSESGGDLVEPTEIRHTLTTLLMEEQSLEKQIAEKQAKLDNVKEKLAAARALGAQV